jgi:prepilin-type N-terminal cleavage/methylation domain-containing protein
MKRQHGFTLVEALAVLILLGLALVPAMRMLEGALQVETVNREELQMDYRLIDRAEVLLSEPFGALVSAARGAGVASPYSDAAGTPNRRLVYISGYDANNLDADDDDTTGADDGILKIRVELEATANAVTLLQADSQ